MKTNVYAAPYEHINLIPERTLPEYSLNWQQDVAFVHHAMHMPDLIETPGTLPLDRIDLRTKLIREEGIHELRRDLKKNDFINVIDACIDTMVVSLGALVEMGADLSNLLDPVINTKLTNGYTLATEMKWAPPTMAHFDHIAKEFSHPLQQQLAHILLLENGELLNEPVFMRHIAENTADHHEQLLAGLTVALENEEKVTSIAYLSNLTMSALNCLTYMGVDAQPFFDEIQLANLSKVDENGLPIHSRGEELDGAPAGKFLKSELYIKPDLHRVFAERYPNVVVPELAEAA